MSAKPLACPVVSPKSREGQERTAAALELEREAGRLLVTEGIVCQHWEDETIVCWREDDDEWAVFLYPWDARVLVSVHENLADHADCNGDCVDTEHVSTDHVGIVAAVRDLLSAPVVGSTSGWVMLALDHGAW